MAYRIETDHDGRDVLVEERVRSVAARAWDRAGAVIAVGCGLGILAMFGSIVRQASDVTTVLITGLLFGVPGSGFVVLGVLWALRGVPRTEVTRHVIDEDALELLGEYPDDFPPKRFLIERGLL